mmetsp:Transcript_5392/g.13478  ORF Transcript_5392/g.13478 Transcript_5392/m.13478 type:complete len:224 (+) Transcript_5392:788-1459(+)
MSATATRLASVGSRDVVRTAPTRSNSSIQRLGSTPRRPPSLRRRKTSSAFAGSASLCTARAACAVSALRPSSSASSTTTRRFTNCPGASSGTWSSFPTGDFSRVPCTSSTGEVAYLAPTSPLPAGPASKPLRGRPRPSWAVASCARSRGTITRASGSARSAACCSSFALPARGKTFVAGASCVASSAIHPPLRRRNGRCAQSQWSPLPQRRQAKRRLHRPNAL